MPAISENTTRRKTAGLLAVATAALLLAACGDDPGSGEPASPRVSGPDPGPASTNVELASSPATPVPTITSATSEPATTGDGPQQLEWDSLIPDDYRPDALMAEYQIEDLSDDDPRAAELMEKLRDLWDRAPVREELDGEQIRLPGFIVPVEADEDETTGFLLVPYYGACIHVPPPPANQTVYVLAEAGNGTAPELFDVVWVTGTMSVKRIANDIAEAGYTLYASEIAPYE